MSFQSLRNKHPRFRYRSFDIQIEAGHYRITFDFLLEPNICFRPKAVLPFSEDLSLETISPFAFHLGLAEMPSYWKAACPQEIVIEAGHLHPEQLSWWHDLFIHGMGEFYCLNEIDFTAPGFLSLEACGKEISQAVSLPYSNSDLVLVGGGKDSSLTLELLRNSSGKKAAFALNPIRAALESAHIAGYTNPVIATRSIDPGLLELNEKGYLNGHTPFSACLAFYSIFAAAANGFKNVIVSNERSSNEPTTTFHGLPVNHQYSKSFRFESLFRDYVRRWLSPDISYFSFLRPLYDLQISWLFSRCSKHLFSFRSCNRFQKADSWCGSCPKCAFVYLSLFPFLDYDRLCSIFGKDLFASTEIQQQIKMLTGFSERKPFDCVGTIGESRVAVLLSLQKYKEQQIETPTFLRELGEKIIAQGTTDDDCEELLASWSSEHSLPPQYESLLQHALDNE